MHQGEKVAKVGPSRQKVGAAPPQLARTGAGQDKKLGNAMSLNEVVHRVEQAGHFLDLIHNHVSDVPRQAEHIPFQSLGISG